MSALSFATTDKDSKLSPSIESIKSHKEVEMLMDDESFSNVT
eukprot:CAMPEP_0184423126 /NCGR_PEP_ID=MMETSP0738-20130409/86858_1 /TAXON_ID=385413 /ORGANISM="Thalassiosira miniscula, Strain CCMP1093" /LENGTH=41 /DNA_ID= /DNA_START= /DNA_END= /DNA_ORIENTATION=